MSGAVDDPRLQRAVAGYVRFQRMKMVANAVLIPAAIAVAVLVALKVSLLWGLVVFFVGTPIVGAAVGPIIMLPLGYLICGRDAMTLGAELERQRR